jgi:hypothetical protein
LMMKMKILNMYIDYQRFFLIILMLLWELTSYCQGIVEFFFLIFSRSSG